MKTVTGVSRVRLSEISPAIYPGEYRDVNGNLINELTSGVSAIMDRWGEYPAAGEAPRPVGVDDIEGVFDLLASSRS